MNEVKRTWRVLCHKQAWLAGTSNYLPDILWDVINCPCRCKLLLVQYSWNVICTVNTTSLCFIEYNVGHTSERITNSVKHNGYVILVNAFCGLCKHTHTYIYAHTHFLYIYACMYSTDNRKVMACHHGTSGFLKKFGHSKHNLSAVENGCCRLCMVDIPVVNLYKQYTMPANSFQYFLHWREILVNWLQNGLHRL